SQFIHRADWAMPEGAWWKPYLMKVGSRKARGGRAPARNPRISSSKVAISVLRRQIKTMKTNGRRRTQDWWNCMVQHIPNPIRPKANEGVIQSSEKPGMDSKNPIKKSKLEKSR